MSYESFKNIKNVLWINSIEMFFCRYLLNFMYARNFQPHRRISINYLLTFYGINIKKWVQSSSLQLALPI